jgi:UrcA family protein
MLKPISALAALASAVALVAPTVGHAQDVRSTAVSYADLNLADEQGQSALQSRIKGAAHQVCDTRASLLELEMAQFSRSCRLATIASAQPAYEAALAAAQRGTVTVLTGAALTITAQ